MRSLVVCLYVFVHDKRSIRFDNIIQWELDLVMNIKAMIPDVQAEPKCVRRVGTREPAPAEGLEAVQ